MHRYFNFFFFKINVNKCFEKFFVTKQPRYVVFLHMGNIYFNIFLQGKFYAKNYTIYNLAAQPYFCVYYSYKLFLHTLKSEHFYIFIQSLTDDFTSMTLTMMK